GENHEVAGEPERSLMPHLSVALRAWNIVDRAFLDDGAGARCQGTVLRHPCPFILVAVLVTEGKWTFCCSARIGPRPLPALIVRVYAPCSWRSASSETRS